MSGKGGKQMRLRLAMEAARIMVEEGVKDFFQAKRKAALRLGATSTQNMPSNSEVEDAVKEYQRLFRSRTQPQRLRALRETAVQAMEFFARFQPRLVGSVLRGTAGEHSDVNLHLFADTAEEVELFLLQNNIPHEVGERRFRRGNEIQRHTQFRFVAGDVVVEVIVFPLSGLHHPPPSKIDGKPMRRGSITAVRELLESGDEGEAVASL